ncbi:MAG: phenylacetate--CoA ligase family protein [Candidatus Omnitrophica bacterium]|nr:phenylacetate--CoA ligase family protein [Candidatus Omnitrophota bacterium]
MIRKVLLPFASSLYSKIPPKALHQIELDNFRKTVRYVYERSKFYRKKFDELNLDPGRLKRPEDLGDFFTTAEDIRQNPEDFVCGKPDTAYETTGTTSRKPKRVYFSRHEIQDAGFSGAVGLWALGIRKEDRVVSAFDYSFWVSGPVLQASCETLGCFHVEAGRMDPEEFHDRLKDYGVTVIVGDPSWIVRLSEVAQKKGSWPVKLILGGGENLTEDARRFVEGVWKTDFILSYGQTEAFGAIGIESRRKNGYHLNELHNYFEIIHPDENGTGELVYTTLNRRVMPLVRYRSGDITRFMAMESGFLAHQKAGGPLAGRRIEKLKGRVDEWMATAMGNIAPWMFENVFKEVRDITQDWQVIVDKHGNKDFLELHVECLNGQAVESVVREQIFSGLKREIGDGWRNFEKGFFELEVKVHPQGILRTGRKLRRIVDKRKF